MIQETVDILWNEKISDGYYRIGFTCHAVYQQAEPGQFVMVRIMGRTESFLRRPFSIHRQIFDGKGFKGIELLYKVVGNNTDKLSYLKRGDKLDLLGPLGKGFRISTEYHHISIVAGGIGVAPLLFLAIKLKDSCIDPFRCDVYLGGRTKGDLLCSDEFSDLGMDVSITTDDGSVGQAGLVTQGFETALKTEKPDMVFACGPKNMLAGVQKITETFGVRCQVSIETLMACGIGACLGCAVEPKDEKHPYFHACKDGPVFDASVLKYPI